jgi:hypothetical protein
VNTDEHRQLPSSVKQVAGSRGAHSTEYDQQGKIQG